MLNKISIYLSGSIKKGTDDLSVDYWTEADETYIHSNISGYTVEILNPATANIKRANPLENFGGDLYLVKKSNIMIADLRNKRGIGVGSEMTMAKHYQIPVISICPNETHYRRSKLEDVCGEDLLNWTHPFVLGLSDVVVENLEEAIDWINDYLKYLTSDNKSSSANKTFSKYQIKDFSTIDDAIGLYQKNQITNK